MLTWRNRIAENALLNFSALLCRPLCNTMRVRLPRELRDRIYGYVLGPVSGNPTPIRELYKQRRLQLWFQELWVGPEILREILELACSTDNIQVDLPALETIMLGGGAPSIGYAAYIRSLELRVLLYMPQCEGACGCELGRSEPLIRPCGRFTFQRSVKALFDIRHKKGFQLRIRLHGSSEGARPLPDPSIVYVLNLLRDVLLPLREEGVVISIVREDYYNMNTPSKEFPDDLMVFYDMSEEEWNNYCAEHLARHVGIQRSPQQHLLTSVYSEPPFRTWGLSLCRHLPLHRQLLRCLTRCSRLLFPSLRIYSQRAQPIRTSWCRSTWHAPRL